jgi:hypothetical protein
METVIPKQPKRNRDQITMWLDREVLKTLEQYCRYLDSGRDWIINQCLTFIFPKDKAFLLWLASQKNENSPATSVVEQSTGASASRNRGSGGAQGRLSIRE